MQDGDILLGAAQDLVDFRFLARSFDLLVVFGDEGDGSAYLHAVGREVWSWRPLGPTQHLVHFVV